MTSPLIALAEEFRMRGDDAGRLARLVLDAHPGPDENGMIAAIDAAMVEAANLHPPMRRSECERLIRAALSAPFAAQQPTADIGERLKQAMRTACDLLAERIQGNTAYSSAHNARIVLREALSASTGSPGQAAQPGEPLAYRHTLHMELDQDAHRLTFTPESPFGVPGKDYSETFPVTSIPLYSRP
jgi:hypothetical protein